MSDLSIGLQLYTVRDQTKDDFTGTIRRVAELGYTGVEFAGYGGLSSQEMKGLLAETGLQAVSSHVPFQAMEQDFAGQLQYCLDIGISFLVVPWLSEDWRTSGQVAQLGERLNEFGRRSLEHGITLGYHNHDFEFAQKPGGTFFEHLLAATDPSLVKLELDTYWAAFAGVDPVAFIRQHAGRVRLVHLKDMSPARTFTEVGDGTLDIASYCQAAKEVGVTWGFVENDAPVIPSLESAKRSLANLRKMF
jgi:sugar phosphate isomerase/epimerase